MAYSGPRPGDDEDIKLVLTERNKAIDATLEALGTDVIPVTRHTQYSHPVLRITEDSSRTWKQRASDLREFARRQELEQLDKKEIERRRAASIKRKLDKREQAIAKHGEHGKRSPHVKAAAAAGDEAPSAKAPATPAAVALAASRVQISARSKYAPAPSPDSSEEEAAEAASAEQVRKKSRRSKKEESDDDKSDDSA